MAFFAACPYQLEINGGRVCVAIRFDNFDEAATQGDIPTLEYLYSRLEEGCEGFSFDSSYETANDRVLDAVLESDMGMRKKLKMCEWIYESGNDPTGEMLSMINAQKEALGDESSSD